MIPYLIAGAIGYGIAKLFEEDESPKFEDGGSVLLAPNGKPSKLTPEQYELVRSQSFISWFGDWENDPANASKVIDEETKEPLIVFHGTNNDFNVFDVEKTRFNYLYFAVNKEYAEKFGKVKSYFINANKIEDVTRVGIKNITTDNAYRVLGWKIEPAYTYNKQKFWIHLKESDEIYRTFKYNNYGAIKFIEDYTDDGSYIETEAFAIINPSIIKLADGSNDTFDSNNPDIRFDGGGELADNIFDYLIKEKGFAPLGKGFWGKSNCTIKIDFSNVLYQHYGENRVWLSPIEYSDYKKAFTILEFHCKDKNKGIGTALLKEIIQGADLFGYTIFIEPTSMKKYRVETDINTNDLKEWYSKYDFKPLNDNYSDNVWLRNPKNPDIRFDSGGELEDKNYINTIRNCLIAQNYSDSAKGRQIYDYELHYNQINKIYNNNRLSSYEIRDLLYEEKNKFIERAISFSKKTNIKIIIGLDERGYEVIYFEFPFGQVSFHLMIDEDKLDVLLKKYKNIIYNENYKWSGFTNSGSLLMNEWKKIQPNENNFETGGVSELLAPNGKPSNLTPEQYKLVRKPEFKAWFGDWENDPANASKVVDYNGEPLPVYHGTDKKFNVFNKSIETDYNGKYEFLVENVDVDSEKFKEIEKYNEEQGSMSAYEDFWFSNISWMEGSKHILLCFLNCRTLYVDENGLGGQGAYNSYYGDGLKITNADGQNGVDYYVVNNPNQIKLADGSNTTFDGNNPDIRYAGGGSITELEKYIKDIEVVDDEDGIMYYGTFGNDGSLTWIVTGEFITVITIDSGNKKGGEGTMAIANLFLSNPKVKTITYQDHSHFQDGTSFWVRIGGDDIYLDRSNFFNYFENKFGFNPDIRFDLGGKIELLAPNGKPSKLTPEQYKLVRSSAFISWFGDWENSPETASKVVDENGEPLVMWHTTNNEFNKFDKRKSRDGFFFSPQKNRLVAYNKSKINSYFLNLINPSHEMFEIDLKYLKTKGYDGIMDYGHAKHLGNKNLYEIIAFEPNQIKLADGSNTTFDGSNPDIRFDEGGKVDKIKNIFLENGFTEDDLQRILEENENYFNQIEFYDNETIIVYRTIALPRRLVDKFIALDKKEIGEGIGEYWTLDKEFGRAVWGGGHYEEELTYEVMCKGHLKIKDIDWEMMEYAYNDDPYNFGSESEIRGVNGGNSIKVVECSELVYRNGGEINIENYFDSTTCEFQPISSKDSIEILNEYTKWRRKKNKPQFIHSTRYGNLKIDFESEKKNSFFQSRSLSYYFISENNDFVIRISDHWSKSNYEKSRKLNCGYIRSVWWTNYGEKFYYRLPAQSYGSDLIGGICYFKDFNKE